MKIKIFQTITNQCALKETDNYINIKKNRFYDTRTNIYQPLNYKKMYNFREKYVYYLFYMGDFECKSGGIHISLNFFQNQKFLFLQGNHWFQKEENLRYIINVLFLLLGTYLSYKQL